MPVPSNMPEHAKTVFEHTMEALKGKKNPRTGKSYTDEERGKIAWSAVKQKYKKKGEKWEAKQDGDFEDEPDEEDFVFSELLEFKAEEGKYYFKGYLSTFDVDLVNDLVTPDCMKDMLNQINAGVGGFVRSMKGSPDHDVYHTGDTQRVPISRITSGKLDNKGLFVEGMFNPDHPEFKNIWNQVQNGFLDGLSIEYHPTDFAFKDINGKKIRVLNKIQLKGYGHTPRPANPYSTLTDFFVKSLELADAEEFIETKGLKETVVSHLHDDIKEYQKMIDDDQKLLAQIGGGEVKEEEKKKDEKEETEEEKKKRKEKEEKVEEKKAEPQPVPAEVKTEAKAEEVKTEVKVEVKPEVKSFDVEQIKALIKEELKNLTPEKKSLPDSTEKFAEEVKTQPTDLIGYVVKGLGGR